MDDFRRQRFLIPYLIVNEQKSRPSGPGRLLGSRERNPLEDHPGYGGSCPHAQPVSDSSHSWLKPENHWGPLKICFNTILILED